MKMRLEEIECFNSLDKIKQIELTEQLLLKLGFVKLPKDIYVYSDWSEWVYFCNEIVKYNILQSDNIGFIIPNYNNPIKINNLNELYSLLINHQKHE